MLRFFLSVSVSLTFSAFLSAIDEPTLEQRLEQLAVTLEAERQEAGIPGMSIAIVKDDEVVWARGFGLADVENETAADENTIYAIGSTTKAFTATLIGTLVDEGKADWDDPVTQYLPYFDLQVRSEDEDAECTLRDLLSHRHGFARMGLLWFGGKLTREEVLRTAAGAEPWDDFRKNFHYCNVTYLAAGEAAGVAARSSWDELMEERIFEPLGMTSSTLSVTTAQKDARLALGYKWEDTENKFEHMKMVDLNAIAPAGSVNSNVIDMAQWIRLQLGKGEVDGKRMLSSEQLLETWSPQIDLGDGNAYGLGWILREHGGRPIVEHGGNIDGFSAQIGLMPEENLGFVLLMNVDVASLQGASIGIVFDALLEEWAGVAAPEEPVAGESEASAPAFDELVGTYVANFASFRDEEFEVVTKNDHLALNIPSQQLFDLSPPDSEGKWSFALTDQVAVSFQRNDAGAVIGLTVHQAGFGFEVPRKGVHIEPEAPAAELEKYVGTFVRARGGKRVKLTIEQGHLTMEDKGNLLAFRVPDVDGHASLRAHADQGATFKVDAEEIVDSFIYHGTSGDQLFTRLEVEPNKDLPMLEEVHLLRNTEARIAALKAGGMKVTGKVWVAQAGVRGEVTMFQQGLDRFANHLDFGKLGRVDSVLRGNKAWAFNSMRGHEELKGEMLTQAKIDHPGAIEGDWEAYFDSVEVVRHDLVDERAVYVIRLRKNELPSRSYWIDAESGDVLKVKQITLEGRVRVPVTTQYSDFKVVGGIRTAQTVEISNPMTGRTVLTLEKFESGLELDDEVFTLEER